MPQRSPCCPLTTQTFPQNMTPYTCIASKLWHFLPALLCPFRSLGGSRVYLLCVLLSAQKASDGYID
jgi:hypothetical protein